MTEAGLAAIAPMSHAIFRVARAHKAIAGRLLREAGLYAGQELVLMALWERGPLRMVDLATAVDSDAPSLTRSVARLEKAGWVTRAHSSSDRRVMIVAAAEASLALRAKVEAAWSELERLTVGPLSPAQRSQALAGLELLENALVAEDS